MSEARENQVIHALTYCDHVRMICGGSSFPQTEGRDLTKMEVEVYDSALTCLLSYFVSDMGSKQRAVKRRKPRHKARAKARR